MFLENWFLSRTRLGLVICALILRNPVCCGNLGLQICAYTKPLSFLYYCVWALSVCWTLFHSIAIDLKLNTFYVFLTVIIIAFSSLRRMYLCWVVVGFCKLYKYKVHTNVQGLTNYEAATCVNIIFVDNIYF